MYNTEGPRYYNFRANTRPRTCCISKNIHGCSTPSHGKSKNAILNLTSFLIEGNSFETRQSSLLYVFVRFFGLDRAQNTIVVYY